MSKIILYAVLLLIPIIPTFWAIIDVSRRKFDNILLQLIWLGIITILPFFGAVGYFVWLKFRRGNLLALL